MTMQKRVLLTLGLTLAVLTALLFVGIRLILLNSFLKLEKNEAYDNILRVQDALNDELLNLDVTTRDWGAWDDAYSFIIGANPDFISSNTTDDEFIDNGINLMLFLNSSGKIAFVKSFDLQSQKEVPVSNDLIKRYFSDNSILTDFPDPQKGAYGIIMLPAGPMLVSAHPIIRSDGTGIPHGSLIMGRYLNYSLVNHLAAITHLTSSIQPYDASRMESFFKAMPSYSTDRVTILIPKMNTASITVYALLKDIYGNPNLVLRVDTSNLLYQEGRLTAIYFLLALLAFAFIFIVVILKYIDISVLNRLHRLSKNVKQIGASGNTTERLAVTGADELASLAGDINDMLGSLEQLRREVLAREAQLRNITDNMHDMICQTDTSGIIQYSSPSYKTVMGYEPEALLGKSAIEHIHSDDCHRAKTAFMKLINTASVQKLEYRSRHSKGHYLWVETIVKPLFDDEGRVTGAIFGTRDITENKHTEAELNKYHQHLEELVNKRTSALHEVNAMLQLEIQERSRIEEARARLADVIEATSDFVVTTDLRRRLLYCNRSMKEMLGIGEEEEISSIPIADIHPEWANRIIMEQTYPAVIRDGIWQGETAFLSRTGREVPVSQVTVAHRGTDGEMTYLSTIARDITAVKQSEERIRSLNVDLERRACELSAVNKELEAFSYSVSHDLRAPLRIIDGFCHVLTEDYHDKLDDEGRENLRIISTQCQRMGELINDLLDLSRLSRKEMLPEDVDLSQITESIAAELQEREPERQMSFAIATGLKARGDRLLLQSVLENLMNNAWKFTSRHAQARIEFGVTTMNGEAAYFVRDDGAGFDMLYAGKLFKPFQRLHTIKEFPGTGIGLASVQRIIQRHGGRVFAEGALDKGATFYFTLSGEV